MFCCNAVTIEHRVQWVPLTDHATSLIARVCGNRRKCNKTADGLTMTMRGINDSPFHILDLWLEAKQQTDTRLRNLKCPHETHTVLLCFFVQKTTKTLLNQMIFEAF